MSLEDFWEVFDPQLELIDRILSGRATPVSRRPWEAVFLFIEHFIVDVSGMEKEDIPTHPMFRDMLQRSHKWYVDKYGTRILEEDPDALGMVIWFETPFELHFPLTLSRPDHNSGRTSVHFPRKVLRTEDSLSFLARPPNLQRLTSRQKTNLRTRISRIVGMVRRLTLDAMTADMGQAEGSALAAGIQPSFERGLQDVCSEDRSRLSTAVWEFNFAAEKALKAFLWQKSRPVPKTHDIPDLLAQAVRRGLPVPPRSWARAFPSGEDAIRHRYGEIRAPTVTRVSYLYRTALRLAVHSAAELERTFSIVPPGGVLYLKPPWD